MTQTWAELEQQCKNCTRCGLAATRQNVVFGVGATDAEVLFIGEGPGANEDAKGEPFVGRAGQLLDTMLAAVGLSRHHNIYIANMVKCRPPQNRDPLPEEQEACIGWLRGQTALLRPKIIVCLGRVAAKRLIKEDFRITQEHGKWFKKGSYDMCAVYHPSALLRDASKREDMLKDMWEIKKKLL
jgi:DNA polymerase